MQILCTKTVEADGDEIMVIRMIVVNMTRRWWCWLSKWLWWIEAVISETKQQPQARYRAWLHSCVRSDPWHPLTLRCSHTFQSSVHHCFQVRPQDSLPRTSQPQLQRTSCWRSAAANAQAAPRSDQGWRDTTTTRLSCGFDFNFSMCFLMFLDVSCAVVITSLHYSCLQNHGRVSMTYRVTCCTKLQSIWTVQANCALK